MFEVVIGVERCPTKGSLLKAETTSKDFLFSTFGTLVESTTELSSVLKKLTFSALLIIKYSTHPGTY